MGDEAHGCVYTRGPKLRLGLCETVFGPLDGGSRNRVNWVDQILGRLEWKKDGQADRSSLEATVIKELADGNSH